LDVATGVGRVEAVAVGWGGWGDSVRMIAGVGVAGSEVERAPTQAPLASNRVKIRPSLNPTIR
jgi:hypothetical protein